MANRRPKRWVETGPLMPWMTRYAQWLCSHPAAEMSGNATDFRHRYPTGDERAARASEYAGRPVQRQLIVLLEKRKDLREYFEKLRSDTQVYAKELAKNQIGRNFELREKGLEMAAESGDHKAIEHYTRPFLEHAFPKKQEVGQGPQRVVINMIGMTPEQKKLLTAGVTEPEEPDEVEWEYIETEKVQEEDE